MKLSRLQKFILLSSFGTGGKIKRIQFQKFYDKKNKLPKPGDQQGIITKSLERMIKRGLLIGYGRRTPEKWFIDEVKLTPRGRKEVRRQSGRQQQLPLNNINKKRK
ncbi:MAG: hypothetical protein WCV50_03195 [Patescibacteria group bacterium]|jgi:hypothetical protein